MKETAKTKSELIKFGLTMTAAFGLLGALLWYNDSNSFPYLASISAFFLILTVVWPSGLAPVEKYWMIFGEKISVVMTTVILSVTFYLVMTPLGFFLKVIGKDILGLKINKDAKSYWQKPDVEGPTSRPLKPY